MKCLECNYHDGWIRAVSLGPRQEVNLSVCLDTVWNPDHEQVELRLGGIFNFDSAAKYFRGVAAETSEVDGGPTIYALHYDEKKTSKEGDVYVFLDICVAGHFRVHCKNVTEKIQ